MEKMLTARQVAEMLQVHPKSVYRWIECGKLATIRLGGNRLRITERQIRDFLAQKNIAKD